MTLLRTTDRNPARTPALAAQGARLLSPSGSKSGHHLRGALSIPANRIDRLAVRMLPDLDAEIVVYSSRTDRTWVAAARRFAALGYHNVVVYEAGKEDWIEHGLPVEREAERA
jgi:rhodanese-related sulfurtransferase